MHVSGAARRQVCEWWFTTGLWKKYKFPTLFRILCGSGPGHTAQDGCTQAHMGFIWATWDQYGPMLSLQGLRGYFWGICFEDLLDLVCDKNSFIQKNGLKCTFLKSGKKSCTPPLKFLPKNFFSQFSRKKTKNRGNKDAESNGSNGFSWKCEKLRLFAEKRLKKSRNLPCARQIRIKPL